MPTISEPRRTVPAIESTTARWTTPPAPRRSSRLRVRLPCAPDRPRRSVLIVANTAEEKGLLGAESFAHSPTVPIERMVAAIDLDMPMLLYDFTDVVAYGATHSTLKAAFPEDRLGDGHHTLTRSNARAGDLRAVRPLHDGEARRSGGDARDRNGERGRQGVGDVSCPPTTTGPRTISRCRSCGVQAPSSRSSTIASYERLRDADDRPQWYAKDYFGDLFAPKAVKAQN